MVKVQRLFAKTNLKIQVFETEKSEAEGAFMMDKKSKRGEMGFISVLTLIFVVLKLRRIHYE